MKVTFICLAALAQLALSAIAEPITIPLYKRTEDSGIIKAAGKALENGVLAGKVKIGNPPQEFVFAFDTTIGYSWVRGSRCKTENCRGRCTYYARKSSDASSTGKKFSVDYGDSCVDTHVYTDTFEFANLTVKNFPFGGAYRMTGFDTGFDGYLGLGRSVDFSKAKVSSSFASSLNKRDALSDSAFVTNAFVSGSGLASAQFGMYTTTTTGFDQSGVSTGTTTTTTNLASSNTTIASNTTVSTVNTNTGTTNGGNTLTVTDGVTSGGFGTLAKRNNNNKKKTSDEVAGYLVLGGVDKSIIKGKMEYIQLADDPGAKAKNWDVCIRHAGFGGMTIEQGEHALASISTATSFIVMPPDQADAFHNKFGGEFKESTRTYNIKCSEIKKLPPLKMTLESHIVELPASYWTYEIDGDRDCCGTKIQRGSSDKDWILGTSLTNAFYTAFDPERQAVGFAIKKGHKEDGLRVYKKSH